MTTRRVIIVIVLVLLAGLLLIPSEKLKHDAEVRAAYEDYCDCLRVDILCASARPCPYPNCMGDFLRRTEQINRRHLLLSTIQRRNLLSGWQPRWYPPAP